MNSLRALCFVLLSLSFAPTAMARGYGLGRDCGGYPRLDLRAPPGHCVGLVADERDGLRFPRRVLEVAPGRFWITDMGSWEPKRGRLLEITLQPPPARVQVRVLAQGLDRPHGLARAPDGRVYVAEAGTVWRSAVPAGGGALQREDVITGLPSDGAHPLKEIVFGGEGRLFISVGSASDACRDAAQTQPLPCPELAGLLPRAAVYEARLGPGPQGRLQWLRPYARGLRNSMGLAWLPGPQRLLQAENSIDYPEADAPAEELNGPHEGSTHGWPYCVAARQAARGYEGRFDCAATDAPLALWPAHAAPLALLLAPGAAADGSLQLFAAWHGPRRSGQRIVRQTLDATGQPLGAPRDWISGWTAQDGVRPQGAPTGLALDDAGRLWIVEDRNRSLLVLMRDPAARAKAAP